MITLNYSEPKRAPMRTQTIVGVVVQSLLPKQSESFLKYFVIAESFRGQGFGAYLVNLVK